MEKRELAHSGMAWSFIQRTLMIRKLRTEKIIDTILMFDNIVIQDWPELQASH